MAAAARERAQRRRKAATGLREGKGEWEAAGRAAVRRREGGRRAPRGWTRSARSGWRGIGRGARPPALAAHPPLQAASLGVLRWPNSVPFPQV